MKLITYFCINSANVASHIAEGHTWKGVELYISCVGIWTILPLWIISKNAHIQVIYSTNNIVGLYTPWCGFVYYYITVGSPEPQHSNDKQCIPHLFCTYN